MYAFGLMLLLGFAAVAVVAFADRFWQVAHELRVIALVGVGIGLAWLADLNLWQLWGVAVRANWMGVLLTGLLIGGLGYVARELLGLFSGLSRKFSDEAATVEKAKGIRRVA